MPQIRAAADTLLQFARTGLNPALVAAVTGGDAFPNPGRVFLRAMNAHASTARTVSAASRFRAGAKLRGPVKTDLAVSGLVTAERWIGPASPVAFNGADCRALVRSCAAATEWTRPRRTGSPPRRHASAGRAALRARRSTADRTCGATRP